jgi:hypothetical protein
MKNKNVKYIIDQNGIVVDLLLSNTKTLEYIELNVYATHQNDLAVIASNFGI